MRLKRIKLAGFKSFVDATSIPFPGEMTAIVGPNGCGKSNVIDAVRWVLGESSAKNLRGDAMTDVIFNGSSARKPVSQCSVELIFDNTSGRIQGEYANYNEISIKRVVTREAISTYRLNGAKCRRRDVTDIFLGTGLGPRSYAIIEQGMISRLIESKPHELRVFIEEAAGISKYKERRRETENRIRHTRENLERLEDVRAELATQLDKLQRQAQAAKRYKELKAQERQLKGELAALKWLHHQNQVQTLEKKIQQSETEYEELIAKQRGDELDLIQRRQSQAELKQQLDDLQQQLFKVSTTITRLEQSQKYNQQRRQQLSSEQRENNQKIEQLQEQLTAHKNALMALQEKLATLSPEMEMLAQQLEMAVEQRESAQQQLSDFSLTYREQELAYAELKQQAQTCHGQIQSTMSMQMRTQQRLTEINQELDALSSDQLVNQCAEVELKLGQVKQTHAKAKSALSEEQDKLSHLSAKQADLNTEKQSLSTTLQQVQAEKHALQSIQQLELEASESADLPISSLWKELRVEQGFEHLVDQVAQMLQNAYVVDESIEQNQQWFSQQGLTLSLQHHWSTEKQAGTLACHILNDEVPHWFNQVYVVDDRDSARQRQLDLLPHQSVICKDGFWLGKDWLVTSKTDQQGNAQRQAQLIQCAEQQVQLQEKLTQLHDQCEQIEQHITQQSKLIDSHKNDCDNAKQAEYQLQSQLGLLQMQVEQMQSRTDKLTVDKYEQERLLEKEQNQLDSLSAKTAEIEERLLDYESATLDYEKQREEKEHHLNESRIQVEQLTQQKYEMSLQHQRINSELISAQDKQQDCAARIADAAAKLEAIQQELTELNKPENEQQHEVEILIEQREQLVSEKTNKSEELNDIELFLVTAEKKQSDWVHQIQQRQANLESLKLECEGYKVRAGAVAEQLDEMKHNLREIVDRLDGEANEKQWQQNLEKVQSALSRLGAVNLAAVEEYQTQFERKKHLDTQYDDLQQALETLEEAIRKIDKETKARFSRTFDNVNEDLKALFPKVFGGGSAYLALTDDDLLETGVTIMARPPGKKNSTIHLLSGGEKALTALSLVFAIFRLNPAPFCLLDEVDAPLDDANVGRFCRLVSEMSKTVQFIYITHNKIAMEMAEHLTGVTMSEPGVSRMVSVDVDEAVAIANV